MKLIIYMWLVLIFAQITYAETVPVLKSDGIDYDFFGVFDKTTANIKILFYSKDEKKYFGEYLEDAAPLFSLLYHDDSVYNERRIKLLEQKPKYFYITYDRKNIGKIFITERTKNPAILTIDLNNVETKETLKNLKKFSNRFFVATTYPLPVVDPDNWIVSKNLTNIEKTNLIERIGKLNKVKLCTVRMNQIQDCSNYFLNAQTIVLRKVYKNASGRQLINVQADILINKGRDTLTVQAEAKPKNLFFLSDADKIKFVVESDKLIDAGDYLPNTTGESDKKRSSEFLFLNESQNELSLYSSLGENLLNSNLLKDGERANAKIQSLSDGMILVSLEREVDKFVDYYFWGKKQDYDNYLPLVGVHISDLEYLSLSRPTIDSQHRLVFVESLNYCFDLPIIKHLFITEGSQLIEKEECIPLNVNNIKKSVNPEKICVALEKALKGNLSIFDRILTEPSAVAGRVLDGGDSFSQTSAQLKTLKKMECIKFYKNK